MSIKPLVLIVIVLISVSAAIAQDTSASADSPAILSDTYGYDFSPGEGAPYDKRLLDDREHGFYPVASACRAREDGCSLRLRDLIGAALSWLYLRGSFRDDPAHSLIIEPCGEAARDRNTRAQKGCFLCPLCSSSFGQDKLSVL